MPSLFDSAQFGELILRNRIVMAPLTRSRATVDRRVPTPIMVEYYRQRATAGLIVSEATIVDPLGAGYAATPGIYTDEQVEGWQAVTKAVHEAGGCIVMQLWHCGRVSDPELLGGRLPVSASAIAINGAVSRLTPPRPYVAPRALELAEIPAIVAAFRKGAENARRAGFDGVEAHGANGYLLDQFLEDGTNKRTDAYGGPVENRARLMLEATDAAISVWGAGRVGMHLSPRGESHGMGDSDKAGTFTYVARELGRRKLAFIFTREREGDDSISGQLKEAFGGPLIANEAFSRDSAIRAVAEGAADAVAFGKDYISNPDLVARLESGAPLNKWDMATFYDGGEKGYTDYIAQPVR
jgi:2,4-dienoyl-CoA reductase-like NADH-dependent reductase (Old Yellow Enzyme family)